jgi:hypothetical protein
VGPPVTARGSRWVALPWLLAGGLTALATWASPERVGRLVSLDWRMGDMTQLLQGLRAMLFVTAALVVVRRHRTAASLARLHPAGVAASLLLLLLSAGTTLAMAELGLRLAHYPFRGTWTPSETAMARYDPELGWAYVPGRRVTQRYGTDPRLVSATFDSLGIRVERADHVWRARDPSVLFIGDSFTMGHGVGANEAFPARVEAFLGNRIQAVNLGVEGYGTDQALLSLQRYIDRFQTRAVVYTFIADHVWRNDNYDRRVYYPDGNWPGSKPLFGLRADSGVVLRKPAVPVAQLGGLHLVQAARVAWTRWGPRPDSRLTAALVREMDRYCKAKGVRLLVVYWSFAQGGTHLAMLRDTGAEVLDLTAGAPPDWGTWVIPGDYHPTPRAHDRAARLIAGRLIADSVVPRKP